MEIGKLNTNDGLVLFNGKSVTLDKVENCLSVTENLIENLDDVALKELLGGSTKDIDKLIENITTETFNVLYGDKVTVTTDAVGYLSKLSEQFEEQLRLDNFNYFITSIFGSEVDVNWHHLEWGELAMKYDKIAILASRDHGKSYFWSNLFPIWKAYRYDKDSYRKDIRLCRQGFMFAHTQDKAEDYLQIIKDHIEDNEILKEKLFILKNGRFGLGREVKFKTGCDLRVRGFGSAVRGFHPGWIICDDTLTDTMIYSKSQRDKSIDYFYSSIRPMLVPGGQVVVVGTPFHHEDLYSSFRPKKDDKESGKWGTEWVFREYPAIFPDGKILWEDRYSFKELMNRRKEYGNLRFSREFLCRPIVSESSLFPWETIKKSVLGKQKDYTIIPNIDASEMNFVSVVAGCDFAKSANVGADYTAFTVWGVDESNTMHLLYVYHKRGSTFNEQIKELKSIWYNFRPNVMVLESNVFQSIYSEYLEDTEMPIKPHHTGTNKNDLKGGLPGLTVLFERGKIKLPYGDERSRDISDLMLSEFSNTTFTDKGIQSVSGHDDLVMSTWLARVGMLYGMDDKFDFEFL